jgi:hypothetical protein
VNKYKIGTLLYFYLDEIGLIVDVGYRYYILDNYNSFLDVNCYKINEIDGDEDITIYSDIFCD